MLLLLTVAFVVIPLAEIYVIVQVGGAIGAGWTILLLIADSLLGAWLLRREGARAFREFRTAIAAGAWPGDAVAQGAMVIVGGTLLLTPGFVTDVVGVVLLIRPTRRATLALIRRWVGGRVSRGAAGGPRGGHAPGVLDVEVVEIRRDPPDDELDAPR